MKIKSILVVEADNAVRGVLCELLEAEGYRVTCVTDYEDALIFFSLSKTTPSLVLADMIRPDRIVDIIGLMRGTAMLRDIPILAMSAYADDKERADGIPIIRKPFTIEELLEKVSHMANGNQ